MCGKSTDPSGNIAIAPIRAVKHAGLGTTHGCRDPRFHNDPITPAGHRDLAFSTVVAGAYDPDVDPITARQVLRIFPDAPLTVELVERAYSEESWARHPSRYQDPIERRDAEAWALSLAGAREVLLREASATATDAAGATPARRRLSGGAIAGIVAGSVALLALISFGIVGAVNLVSQAATTAQEAIDEELDDMATGDTDTGSGDFGDSGVDEVERYESSETFFTFPAAMEAYADGRYDEDCSLEYVQGCWESALFTESDCDTLQVQLGFSNDANALLPDHLDTMEIDDVVAGEATPVVFGNDDFGYGWIQQVTCLDETR